MYTPIPGLRPSSQPQLGTPLSRWDQVKIFLPPLQWLRTYSVISFIHDVLAGMTVAFTLIPQSLAYATLAELPLEYGLYSSYLGGFIYCLLGSVKDTQVGPASILCLMVGQVVLSANPDDIPAVLCTLTLWVGIFQLALFFCKLGFILDFISHPVLVGFTNASAVTVAFKQVNVILGISIEPSPTMLTNVINLVPNLSETNGWSLMVGAICIALILIMKYIHPLIPRNSIVVFVATLLTWLLGLDIRKRKSYEVCNLKIVGQLPNMYPKLQMPDLSLTPSLITSSMMMALVGLIEHTAVAKSFARLTLGKANMNSELLSLGITNSISSLLSAFPVTGSFSRSTLSFEAGAKTQLCAGITSLVTLLAMLFLKDAFTFIPDATLGAILLVTVWGLMDFTEMLMMLYIGLLDFVAMILTFLGVLLLGADKGILIGVSFSFVVSLHRISRPEIIISQEEEDEQEGNRPLPDLHPTFPVKDFLVVQLNESLWFPNAQFFSDYLISLFTDARAHYAGQELAIPRGIILDFRSVHTIDESGLLGLIDTHKFISHHGAVLIIVGAYRYVRAFLENASRILPAFTGPSRIIMIQRMRELSDLDLQIEWSQQGSLNGDIEMRPLSNPSNLSPAHLTQFTLPPADEWSSSAGVEQVAPPMTATYPRAMWRTQSSLSSTPTSPKLRVPEPSKLYTSGFTFAPVSFPQFTDSPWLRPMTSPTFTPKMVPSNSQTPKTQPNVSPPNVVLTTESDSVYSLTLDT